MSQDFFDKNFKREYECLKYLVIRENNGVATITIVASKDVELSEYYADLQKLPIKCGLSYVVGNSDNNILSGKYNDLYGNNSLCFNENGIKYSVDNLGFLQVNNEIKSKLYNEIIENIEENETLVDGYSGAGLLTAMVSKKCKKAIGVDVVASSIKSAKNLASENRINNIEFYLGDFKLVLPKILRQHSNITLLLDPPRSGCDKAVLDKILEANKNTKTSINKIIYVSCNPATLARDLSILKTDYNIEKIQPMDMFPQTKHVETLVILKNKCIYGDV